MIRHYIIHALIWTPVYPNCWWRRPCMGYYTLPFMCMRLVIVALMFLLVELISAVKNNLAHGKDVDQLCLIRGHLDGHANQIAKSHCTHNDEFAGDPFILYRFQSLRCWIGLTEYENIFEFSFDNIEMEHLVEIVFMYWYGWWCPCETKEQGISTAYMLLTWPYHTIRMSNRLWRE